jgi:hypothetical protein
MIVRPRRARHYYVVGATDDGTGENFFDAYIERGYWTMTWPDNHPMAQKYHDIRSGMRRGDRIAIKKRLGRGEAAKIMILATGVVKDYDPVTKLVFVEWMKTDYRRKVPSKGCYAAAHGPYYIGESEEWDDWINSIFRL